MINAFGALVVAPGDAKTIVDYLTKNAGTVRC
jgi:hypothetical protein